MQGEEYTPELVRAILLEPREHSPEEQIDVAAALVELSLRGNRGAVLLGRWAIGYTQKEAMTALCVSGNQTRVFRKALKDMADYLNGEG